MYKKIDFAILAKSLNANFLKNTGVTLGHWFVGSALQAINFKELKQGIYYYEQPTIWTRMLQSDIVNPYWEIKNDTVNFLVVNESEEKQVNLLNKVLGFYLERVNENNDSVYFFGQPWTLLRDNTDFCNIFHLNVPFFIENNKVGSYLKIFQKRNGRYYPLIDCTRFKFSEKVYFEVNINLSYIEMAQKQLNTIFDGVKYCDISSIFKCQKLTVDQRFIRLYSLAYTLHYLYQNNFSIDSKYLGHSIKKMIKMFALQAFLLDLPIEKFESIISDFFYKVFVKEVDKLYNFDTRILNKYDSYVLSDRFGITKDVQLAFTNKASVYRSYKRSQLLYYTDIPFCQDIDTNELFVNTMHSINNMKVKK